MAMVNELLRRAASSGGWLNSRWILPACLLVGAALRLLLILGLDVVPFADAQWYYDRAGEISRGMGYQDEGAPTALWPVGYPAFLAALFVTFGQSVKVGLLANLVLWAISLLLIYRIALRLSDGQRMAANIAVLLYSVYLNALGYVGVLLTETLYTTLLLMAWAMVIDVVHGRWRAVVPLGLLLGASTLVKAQTWIILPLWAAVTLILEPFKSKPLMMKIGCILVLTLATVLPWSLRNQQQLGAFVLVSTNGGTTFASGNHDRSNGTFSPDDHPNWNAIAWSTKDQVAADRRAREMTWRWIRENPGKFLALAPAKFWWAFVPDGESEYGYKMGYSKYEAHRSAIRGLRWLNQAIYGGLLVITGVSFFLILRRAPDEVRRHWAALSFVLAIFVSLLGITFIFNGQSRFHFPLMALICICNGWMIGALSRVAAVTATEPRGV